MSENKKSFFKDKSSNNGKNKEGKQGKFPKKWGKSGAPKKGSVKSGSAETGGVKNAGAKSFGAKRSNAKSFGAKSSNAKSGGAKSSNAKNNAAKNNAAKNNVTKMKAQKVVPSMPSQWYYLCPQEISVSEIRDCLQDQKISMDIWKEAGVLTLNLGEKKNLDFEEREVSFGNDADDAFLQELNTKALFDISMTPGAYEFCQPYFQMIVDQLGGCICADTEDFQPRIG